jgi:hypothetical protein
MPDCPGAICALGADDVAAALDGAELTDEAGDGELIGAGDGGDGGGGAVAAACGCGWACACGVDAGDGACGVLSPAGVGAADGSCVGGCSPFADGGPLRGSAFAGASGGSSPQRTTPGTESTLRSPTLTLKLIG